jgi:hypothetical protein
MEPCSETQITLQRCSAAQCCTGDVRFQWEGPIFENLPCSWTPLDRSKPIFAKITTPVESRNLPQLMAIASGVSAPQYDEVAGFV